MVDRVSGCTDGGTEAEGQGTFDPAASAGLFVGVSSFEDERIAAVPFAVDDAVDLAYLFALELGLVLPERTVLLLAGEPRKPESVERLAQLVHRGVRRQSARMRDVYEYLGKLARGTEERGLFLLTVATHGVSDQGGDFLVATDSLGERALRTGIAVAEMFDEVARAGAGRRLVLLDACRERLSQGTRGKDESAMAQSFADAISYATGLVVLSGATLGGFAYDDGKRRNGVFTAAVLDGLRGKASAGPEGWITVRTLADFVQQRVSEWVHRNRPDHVTKSLGIARRIEATAEALPLAPHPEAMRERERYGVRRETAIARVRANLGKVLTGKLWDQIVAQLPEAGPRPETEQLLKVIENLDGTEANQRILRDFLYELWGDMNAAPSRVQPQEPYAEADFKKPRTTDSNFGVYSLIPAGGFLMGSGRRDSKIREHPQRKVTITRDFYLSRHPVTVRQFASFIEATSYKTQAEKNYPFLARTWQNPGLIQSAEHPVVCVSWFDAQEYCTWLSEKENRVYRLPREAEWEYACRADSEADWFCGDLADLDRYAWYGANSQGNTHPTAAKSPNPLGLYDVLGQVWEWCSDWYGRYPVGPQQNPAGPPHGRYRIARGGSFVDDPANATCSFRVRVKPFQYAYNIGFRVAREA